jgi:hypothetical protein
MPQVGGTGKRILAGTGSQVRLVLLTLATHVCIVRRYTVFRSATQPMFLASSISLTVTKRASALVTPGRSALQVAAASCYLPLNLRIAQLFPIHPGGTS